VRRASLHALPWSTRPTAPIDRARLNSAVPALPQASVEAAVAANPSQFVVADTKWTGGTEQMLDAVGAFFKTLEGVGGVGGGGCAAAAAGVQQE
jgi:hypothetical protein